MRLPHPTANLASVRKKCLPFCSLLPKCVLKPNLHTPKPQSETESTSLQLKALAKHAEVKGWVERIQALECFVARLCRFSISGFKYKNQVLNFSTVGHMQFALRIGSISEGMPSHFERLYNVLHFEGRQDQRSCLTPPTLKAWCRKCMRSTEQHWLGPKCWTCWNLLAH